jgi:CBS domain containing-hemolysin-like protein
MISITAEQLLVLLPPLLITEGFFSGSEIALLSADKLKLKQLSNQGHSGAKMALELANHPERIFSTTLLLSSLCIIAISALISLYFFEARFNHSEWIAIGVTSPLIVLLGELIPKTIYQQYADQLALWVAYPLTWTYWSFFPITRILSFYTNRIARIVGPIEELLSGKKRSTREEIRSLLSYSKAETEIKKSEKQIIKRIFDFRYSEAQHALIPLVRVDAIDESATVLEALQRFEQHRHSRMPVYSERIDNIIGVLETTDLLTAGDLKQLVHHFISPAHYVSETQSLEDLLLEMRQEDKEMVVVVDEHGGAVGILTFEDIIEEIVGEIQDEYDYESLPYKQIDENHWIVQAQIEIKQINDVIKLAIPEGNYETLSGFLLQQFGRIPKMQDELHFHTASGAYRFFIQRASLRHIESVLIEKLDSA